MKDYQLDIYTWPAGQGVEVGMRTTYWDDPADARAHVEAQTEPFAYATLQKKTYGGYEPCDWEGNPVQAKPWPRIDGVNKEHPARTAIRLEWESLVVEIAHLLETTGGGALDLADEIVKARHPQAVGLVGRLAYDIAAYRKRQREKAMEKRTERLANESRT